MWFHWSDKHVKNLFKARSLAWLYDTIWIHIVNTTGSLQNTRLFNRKKLLKVIKFVLLCVEKIWPKRESGILFHFIGIFFFKNSKLTIKQDPLVCRGYDLLTKFNKDKMKYWHKYWLTNDHSPHNLSEWVKTKFPIFLITLVIFINTTL